jgi:hypothetical protein
MGYSDRRGFRIDLNIIALFEEEEEEDNLFKERQ